MEEIRWTKDTNIKHLFNLMHFDSIITSVFLNCNNEWSTKCKDGETFSYKTRKEAFDFAEEDNSMIVHEYIGFDEKLTRPRERR